MLPTSYVLVWGPGALYAELYIGMCRALAAPWLGPWVLDRRSSARSSPPAQSRSPCDAAPAEPAAAASEARCPPHSAGAAIIPFDRARARRAGGAEAITS